MQKFKHFLGEEQLFEVYTDHMILKTLITYKNLYLEESSELKRWYHLTLRYIIDLK